MTGFIRTAYLGSTERTSERGNKYTIVTFMDDGEPCSAMLSADFKGELPEPLTEVDMELHMRLGRYQKVEVLSIGC